MLCLYDNAGEHFQPGQDTTSSPVTRHLALARAVLFLFDPTQDLRFRAMCRHAGSGSSTQRDSRLSRQETILNEAAARVRRYAGLSQYAKFERPLIVILSKFDEWSHLLGSCDSSDPWRTIGNFTGVDLERIENQSLNLRRLMLEYCGETVAAAEGFARDVTYIPVSSLGSDVELDPATGLVGIRPKNVHPHWVAAPLLYCLCRTLPSLIPRLKRKVRAQ
jgi:hypothetical protein